MKTLLIDQPGRFGDIIICLPIAKWYSQWYSVDWLCPERFHSIFENIEYCRPVMETDKNSYTEIVDISFGINMGTEVEDWWQKTRNHLFSFVEGKYIKAGVPLEERWKLEWTRNKDKELALYEFVTKKHGYTYNLVHEKSEGRFEINIPVENKVVFEPIEGYSIFDWYTVINYAKEIHCIDSVLCNLVEVVMNWAKPKFYYNNKPDPQWNKTIIRNNWRVI
jgi:hypothetical protein